MSRKSQIKLCHVARTFCGFEDETKDTWHSEVRKICRNVVKRLVSKGYLKEKECGVYSNKAGPAVLGEVVIRSSWFHVYFGDQMIMYRTCNGLDDFEGGQNRWISYKFIQDELNKYDKKTDDGYGSIEDIVCDRLFALSLLRN